MIETTNTNETPQMIGTIDTPKQFYQLGVLVMDGSGSMNGASAGNISKAQATNNSVRELLTRFKASRVKKNFAFAVVTFDDSVGVRLQPTDVGPGLDDNGDYNPLVGHGEDLLGSGEGRADRGRLHRAGSGGGS
jgi:hypothetical protein